MGVSVHVSGIRLSDSQTLFDAMWEIKIRCKKAGITVPDEVKEYLGEAMHCDNREEAEKELGEMSLKCEFADACEGDVEYGDGMTIDLKKLPSDITKLRVYMR